MHKNPICQFKIWQKEVTAQDPNAAAVATASKDADPSVRMVLVKFIDDNGFVFYTNLGSKKARDICQNNKVALLFYWDKRQVRIEGCAKQVSDYEADKYFDSRPKKSKIVSILSRQSSVLKDEQSFLNTIEQYEKNNIQVQIKRPNHWHGFRIKPNLIEFWQQRDHRCHKRVLYKLQHDNSWAQLMLYP